MLELLRRRIIAIIIVIIITIFFIIVIVAFIALSLLCTYLVLMGTFHVLSINSQNSIIFLQKETEAQ